MINIAIVENEQEAVDQLQGCLNEYAKQNNEPFKINAFLNGNDFLNEYKPVYDVVFMDVDMPEINGFKVAKKLRELDQDVTLVFVTNLSRYAIRGYEYQATDYILKPLEYSAFSLKLNRILNCCKNNRQKCASIGDSYIRLEDIYYIEIKQHDIYYHTAHGVIKGYGTLKKLEEEWSQEGFARCNSCFLVNLRHVQAIDGYNVKVNDEVLLISHPKKKSFVEAVHNYLLGK